MIYQGNEKMDYIVIRSINSICIYFSYTKLYEICIRQVDYQGNEKMDYKRIRTAYTVTNVLLCLFIREHPSSVIVLAEIWGFSLTPRLVC